MVGYLSAEYAMRGCNIRGADSLKIVANA